MKINHFKIFIFQLRINSKLNMVRGVTPQWFHLTLGDGLYRLLRHCGC